MASDEPDSLKDRIARVRRAIEVAAARAGRTSESVRLVAVTKTVPTERILEAWQLGVRIFGENYVQQALTKIDRLPREAQWHFIGHLQSNKAKLAVELFSMIQCLDRPSLADSLERAARASGTRLDVLIQVNTGAEGSKSGTTPEGAEDLARRAGEWPSIRVKGLMAIPPYFADAEQVRPHFRALRHLAHRIRSLGLPGVEMTELSMGMSSDFEIAIEEGATLVRIGTAVFGDRPVKTVV